MELAEYQHRYEHVRLERSDGVLEVTLHTDGDTLVWGTGIHRELPAVFADIAADDRNRVVILTGAGDAFCERADSSLLEVGRTAAGWSRIHAEGTKILQNLLAIEVPVITALNGPARVHAEIPVLSDVVLAAEHSYFQDLVHVRFGLVPGDGVQIVWPLLLGPNRGRYFLLTAEKIGAQEAKALGVVGEVLPADEVLTRARELAHGLAKNRRTMLRHTRLVFTERLKRELAAGLDAGLTLEALAALDTED